MDSLAPTSIKNLPPELLARIFQFTHDDDHCLVTRGLGLPDILQTSLGYPEQPHTLSHVCSTWRRIALATPSLWSHIDIAIDHDLNPQLFIRAKLYAQRAGRHALEVHFLDPGSQRQEQRSMERWHRPHLNFREFEDLHEFDFLDASTLFISSLVVEIYVFDDFRNVHYSAIEYFLANCTPGALTHYTTRLFGEQLAKFFDTSYYSEERSSQLEDAWDSVQVVHLDGLGPRWESKLYHGLVDLRLEKEVPSMTITELVDILKASPALRILHLNNCIEFQVAEGTPVVPVRLDDLEVLNIEYYSYSADLDDELFQWIQPGIKPLRLTFFGVPTEEIHHFFKRSNVTRFYTAAWGSSMLTDLLHEAPQLKTLVLSGFHHNVDSIGVIIDPTEGEGPPARSVPITIDTLHLMSFRGLKLGDIQEAVDRYSIRKIFLWSCCLTFQSSTDKKETAYKDETLILQKLSEIKNCPVIECLTNAIYSSDWE